MTDQAIWLTEEDVRASATLNDVIEALQATLVDEANAKASNLDKTLATWDGGSSMHALGSMMPQAGFVGFKTWAYTPQGGAAVFSLFNADNGRLLAVMEAGGLGQMRTAAIAGVATRLLARPDAADMALIGTGAQAMMQVAAVAATRPLDRLRVFSRTPERRADFAERARGAFGFEVTVAKSLEDAVSGANIVTLITRCRDPFLKASIVSPGTHINAAGAILPANAEFLPDIFDRASLVAVDNLNNARKASREFIDRYGSELGGWSDVHTLGELLRDQAGRPGDADLTLFKPMGMGLSDLSVASLVYGRARAAAIGTPLPKGSMAAPRWVSVA